MRRLRAGEDIDDHPCPTEGQIMTMPNDDIERADLLDRLACEDCVRTSSAMFLESHVYCHHTKIFLSVSRPGNHRKLSALIDVEPADLGVAIIDAFGEDALLAIMKNGGHFHA